MNISGLPFTNWLQIDDSGKMTGNLSANAQLFLEQLVTQLQKNLSNNGYIIPQQTTTYINNNLANSSHVGLLVYDSDTNELKININGTMKVVQVM